MGMKPRIFVGLAVFMTFFLGSCGENFTSVREFGDTREKVKESSNDFADDIYQSCLRRIRFVNLSADNGVDIQNARRRDCERIEKVDSQQFKKAMTTLINYMEALSSIAGGEKLSLDESIDNLGSSIKELSVNGQKLDAPAVDGGIKILKVLFDLVTKKIRQDALRKAIVCSNEPIHQYITGRGVPVKQNDEKATGGLIFLVEQGYIKGTLKIEQEAIITYYTPFFTFLNNLGRDREITNENYRQIVDRITVGESLSADYNQHMNIVSDKTKAAISFNKILMMTANTHNQLSQEYAEGLDAKKISNLCQFNQQVSLQEVDPQKMQRIRKILQDYMTAVKPLLEEVQQAF